MSKIFASTVAAAFGLGGALGALALLGHSAGDGAPALSLPRPVWTEVQWPFPLDPWGGGKAYRCKPADCGAAVDLYLRAKLGLCNCTRGVADDADLDGMGDLYLVGGVVSPLGAGRPIMVASMKGRSRAYALNERHRSAKTAISVAFSDRCDMIVATVVLPHDRPEAVEPDVMAFLNSGIVLRWAEVSLGL